MKYEHNFYRTSDRELDIEFFFLDLGEELGWRAYVISDIDYNKCSQNRSAACSKTHRFCESDETMRNMVWRFLNRNETSPLYYVCWTEKLKSLPDAREVAKAWCEITSYYIKRGGDFAKIQQTLSKRGII